MSLGNNNIEINNNMENKNEKIRFNFDERITTVSLASYFKHHYSNKFIYQKEHMYYFNGVYWICEHKADLTQLNLFLGNEYFKKLTKEFNKYKKDKLKVQQIDSHNGLQNTLNKIEGSIRELQNYDKRIKIVKECVHFLTNNDIEFNNHPFLFAFNNKIYDLLEGKFIKAEYKQYISTDMIMYMKTMQKKKLN